MKFLISVFGGMFTQLFAQFLLVFGRKYGVALSATLAFVAATLAMIVCLKGLILTVLAGAAAPSWFLTFLAWIMPTNWILLFTTIMSGRACRAAYDGVVFKISLISQSS